MNVTPKTIVTSLLITSGIVLVIGGFSNRLPRVANPPADLKPTLTPNSQAVFQAQEKSDGNVTIIVVPLTLTPNVPPSFDITFDTHSVNLDFDAAQIASLTDDQGFTYGTPVWNGSPPGGHHRKGTLTFKKPLIVSRQTVILTFVNLANIPSQSFTWEVRNP